MRAVSHRSEGEKRKHNSTSTQQHNNTAAIQSRQREETQQANQKKASLKSEPNTGPKNTLTMLMLCGKVNALVLDVNVSQRHERLDQVQHKRLILTRYASGVSGDGGVIGGGVNGGSMDVGGVRGSSSQVARREGRRQSCESQMR